MKDENREIKVSEEMERGGQCELDDNALEQAAGGGSFEQAAGGGSQLWGDKAWEWVKEMYNVDDSQ